MFVQITTPFSAGVYLYSKVLETAEFVDKKHSSRCVMYIDVNIYFLNVFIFVKNVFQLPQFPARQQSFFSNFIFIS